MNPLLLKLWTALKVLGPYIVKLLGKPKDPTAKEWASGAGHSLAMPYDGRAVQNTTDGRAWAAEWAKVIAESPGVPYDAGAMITWFSHAIMTGYDAGVTYTREYPASEAAAAVADPKPGVQETCVICKWANIGLLNVGEFGSPVLVCPPCLKKAIGSLPISCVTVPKVDPMLYLKDGAVSVTEFETDTASLPRSAKLFGTRHLCAVCNKHPAECEAKGITYGIDVDPKAKGPEADKVIACESFEAKPATE